MSACEGELVCKATNPKIPFFNAPIYTENKQQIGKIDEILGPLDEVYFTVKLQDSKSANAYKQGDKFYIGSDKLLPMERFLPKPKVAGKGNYIAIGFVDLLTCKIVGRIHIYIHIYIPIVGKPTGLQGKVEKKKSSDFGYSDRGGRGGRGGGRGSFGGGRGGGHSRF